MGVPTRLNNGVGTVVSTHPLGMFPLPNPQTVYMDTDDFTRYLASDWVVTAGGAGSSVALTTGVGGKILNTCATSGVESITGGLGINITNATASVNGLKTWFRARVTLDATVANPDYQIGLTTACTTFNGATSGIYFTKATTATVWSFVIRTASTSTTVALPASTIPTASQTLGLAWYFDGKGMFYIYMDNVCIGTYGSSNGTLGTLGSDLANLPAATIYMGPTFLNAFHTATSTLTVDYYLAACEVVR